ncbi:hypothetical protein SUGI_0804650 [Cryptomeria japonica]|nr:hypothetical protein SUGI_0804650 [Cryptomeria japonica]
MESNQLKETTRKLISDRFSHLTKLPENYIRASGERPRLHEVVNVCTSIPVVDMKGWWSNNSSTTSRSQVVNDIGRACQEYGFFQIINHDIPDSLSKKMLEVAAEFFEMPIEDRIQWYSDDPSQTTRVSSSFNITKEGVLNWRDYLRHYCYPLEDYVHTWPSNPSNYREVASEYCREVRSLVLRLLEAISESLGLETDFLNKAIGSHGQHMCLNYYPKCPDPELTYGLPPHSDPTVLTVLLQDGVPGLQIFKNGQWIAVNAVPNSFVVNVGDQIEVISNGKYKSVVHRAVVNSNEARISIPTFYFPSEDATIEPAPALVDFEPALFRSFKYKEYYSKFWSKELEGKSCLGFFKHNDSPPI